MENLLLQHGHKYGGVKEYRSSFETNIQILWC